MLTVSNINTFYGAAHILHDISLTISRGKRSHCWDATEPESRR